MDLTCVNSGRGIRVRVSVFPFRLELHRRNSLLLAASTKVAKLSRVICGFVFWLNRSTLLPGD